MLRAFALSAVLLPWSAGAQDAPTLTTIDAESLTTAAALRDRALERSEAYALVESLTTEVGHRMAGSANDARGVQWAVEKLHALGYDRVYTEPVRYPVWTRGSEHAEIVGPFPQPLRVTALGASSGTGRGGLEAEIAEYATLAALREARAEDVRGRIVFIGNRMRRERDGSGYGPAVEARTQGAVVAAAKGARALLIRSIGTDDDRVPHTGAGVSRSELLAEPGAPARYRKTRSGIPIVPTPIPAAALSNPDADLLGRVLERGLPVRVRLVLDVGYDGEHEGANVIGEITGSERPDEVVLIGGHLDSWDLGTGAIDDAAGVAVAMAAGHLIGKHAPRPKRTIRVVAFANEEQGVYGGRAYADAHGADVARHMIAAESDFGAARIWRFDTRVKPEALGAVDQMMQVLAPLGIARGTASASGGADLGAMRDAGMAVASLLQDGTRYFDIHHTANDTLDKIEPKDLDQNVAAYAVFAYLAAQAEGDFGSTARAQPAPTEH
jgi:hypothetical protein